MKYPLRFPTAVVALATISASYVLKNNLKDRLGLDSVFLGCVDNKCYMYDNTKRTWAEAKNFCNASGMMLASVTSSAQKTFLDGKWSAEAGGFNIPYWIGGRDARTLQQFVWDSNSSPVSDSLYTLEMVPEQKNCLNLHFGSPSSGHLDAVPCDVLYGSLCEG